MIRVLLSSIFIFGINAGSGGDDNCPDQIAFEKKTQVEYGPDLGCGGSNVNLGSVQMNDPVRNCPAFAVITPAHAGTRHSKDPGTFTRPFATVPVTRLNFACKTRYFLIFPIGRQCTATGYSVVRSIASYHQFACSDGESQG